MSYNIFYTEVDKNLQSELNARGNAGFNDRSNAALDYMLGKVANVQLTAYQSSGSNSAVVGILGGAQVRGGRYQPNEFLSNPSYTRDEVKYWKSQTESDFADSDAASSAGNLTGRAYKDTKTLTDKSRRVGPYITDASINIGDHSFGLLNKADIKLVIPNVERDLDWAEDIFFRPGRFVRIDVTHPASAVITRNSETAGLLTPNVIPNDKKLKELYPGLMDEKLDNLKNEIRRMNSFRFEGLITNFDFSYDKDGTVNASLKLTGTSNVYTDVSMFQSSDATKEKEDTPTAKQVNQHVVVEPPSAETGSNYTSQFYEQLYDKVDRTISADILVRAAEANLIKINDVTNAKESGEEVKLLLSLDLAITEKLPTDVLTTIDLSSPHYNPAVTNDQWILKGDPYPSLPENKFATSIYDYRYISLGALIQFMNETILIKVGGESSVTLPIIMCNELTTTSNYYPSLVSADPASILLLPEKPHQPGDMNTYGDLTFYQTITDSASTRWPWPGVYEEIKQEDGSDKSVIYTSRILINLNTIHDIIITISNQGRRKYDVKSFLANISSKIRIATGGAIDLKLVTHPTFQDALLFADVKSIQPIPESKPSVPAPQTIITKRGEIINMSTAEPDPNPVEPYSVPMFANHPNGSICRDFKFSATIPDNVKNLAYVLNTSDEISESDIAPFMNFMYTAGSGDVDAINKFLEKYEKQYIAKLEALDSAKHNFGNEPNSEESKNQIRKALLDHMKFPVSKIQDAQQLSAPVFPFQAEFTIDGINGLRYGDVLIFNALPSRYKVNTVFSIIGITHNVTNNGVWTSAVKCIMRPNIQ